MKFNKHSPELRQKHAFLSPSKSYWISYDQEKLKKSFSSYLAIERGNSLHEVAYHCIKSKIKLERNKNTLNMYVNDAVTHGLTPEQTLYYSPNAFGTADAIGFNGQLLRIYDLKTGETKASIRQLMIYAAYFCLEYEVSPLDIEIELRIYQNGEVFIEFPSGDLIKDIMDRVVQFDRILEKLKEELDV